VRAGMPACQGGGQKIGSSEKGTGGQACAGGGVTNEGVLRCHGVAAALAAVPRFCPLRAALLYVAAARPLLMRGRLLGAVMHWAWGAR